MSHFRLAATAVLLTLLGSVSSLIAEPASGASSPSGTNTGSSYGYIGLARSTFSPLGETPRSVFSAAPQEWTVTGWDLSLGVRGKSITGGPVYMGGGIGFQLGGGSDEFSGSTTWHDESYSRIGIDASLDLGVRLPIGRTAHLDLGGQVGGYASSGSSDQSSFRYGHTILWAGPGFALEPNKGSRGFILTGGLRYPIAGGFGMENLLASRDKWDYDVDSGSILRIEAGYKFTSGFAIVLFSESGSFKYVDGDNPNQTFDQSPKTIGIELRITP